MQSNLLGIVLIVLVSSNLALTTALYLRDDVGRANVSATVERESLPGELTEGKIESLAESISAQYNRDDIQGLYDRFDALAKIELTFEEFESQFRGLRPIVGRVESSVYADFQVGDYEGRRAYELRYRVSLRDGPFSKGSMKITVLDRGDRYTLLGFRVNGESN